MSGDLYDENQSLKAQNTRLREEIEQWRKEAQFKEDERVRLREALREVDTVIQTMMNDDWPIPRLAPRLVRLQAIARNALKETT